MSELGPVSQAILEYVNSQPGFISFWHMIRTVSREENVKFHAPWWFRRLVALALEGHIEATVYRRPDDNMSFKYRRLQETEEKPETVWVPRGYYSKSKIKEDDVQMIIIEVLQEEASD